MEEERETYIPMRKTQIKHSTTTPIGIVIARISLFR